MKGFQRAAAFLLAGVLSFGGGSTAYAEDLPAALPAEATGETQIASEPEIVYINSYDDRLRTHAFNDGWKFYLGEADGAEQQVYDDASWRTVNLPHDYSIEQSYSQQLEAESGYLPGGTGWYRKSFSIPKGAEGKRIHINFDGVYMNATVWVNGQRQGIHHYGYSPFAFDITDAVKFGEDNVVAVKVEHRTPSSRWYSGSGIYRDVTLSIMDSTHVDRYGVQIQTPDLSAQAGGAVTMNVKTTVVNDTDQEQTVSVKQLVFPKGGTPDAAIGTVTSEPVKVQPKSKQVVETQMSAQSPALWSLDAPNLYTVQTQVLVNEKAIDTVDTTYGFRYFHFDGDTGFSLNGKAMKLKGVCMHHDQGSLGAAAYHRAIERQVEILKQMGANSIRVTHNPASQALIDVCDEKGVLLIEEAFDGWFATKNYNREDYANYFSSQIGETMTLVQSTPDETWAHFDIQQMVRRGLNAPSIIMWSLGNEVMEGTVGGSGSYPNTTNNLSDWVQAIDTTRPVTTGDNRLKSNDPTSIRMAEALHAHQGVVGLNYANGRNYDHYHRSKPWAIYGAETASAVGSRGIYNDFNTYGKRSEKVLTSYNEIAVPWGHTASDAWYDIITRDYVAGTYVWTGFDYLGEPTPWNGITGGSQGSWPAPKNSYFGIIDTAGFPKDDFYLYQSVWNEHLTTLHVLPAWNENVVWKDRNGKVPVVVYSDARSVELFLNGQSLGKKTFTPKKTPAGHEYQIYEGDADRQSKEHKNLYLTWYVPFEAGKLEAVAYDENDQVIQDTAGRSIVETTGKPAKIRATADRSTITADGRDLSYITLDVLDAQGRIVPDAKDMIHVSVEGAGELIALDNGLHADHTPFQEDSRAAHAGQLLAIVRSTKEGGGFTVNATASGLSAGSVQVSTQAAETPEDGAEKQVDHYRLSRNYYVKVGSLPELPAQVEVFYTDGSHEMIDVKWAPVEESQVQEMNEFSVVGTTALDDQLTIYVNVIDEVAALLNYSATTPVGVVPHLPQGRPGVIANGTVLRATFGVQWQMPEDSAFQEAKEVVIPGTATVFGKELSLTATIRVQDETVSIGENLGPKVMTLSQDIPKEYQSDTLNAIVDGSTELAKNLFGGPNPSAWSNYDYSQEGHNTAQLQFVYATQQRFGQVVIHFWRDTFAARYPDANTTEIYISESGDEGSWHKVDARETIGEEKGNVKAYTYDFAPITATFVRIKVTNADEVLSNGKKPCTGITEVELRAAEGKYITYGEPALEKLVVNGESVSQHALDSGSYATLARKAEIEVTPKENTAVTVLPAYENVVRIILESEDHLKRGLYTIHLDTKPEDDPADDSRDVALENLKIEVASEQVPQDVKGNAIDDNYDTMWHTKWGTSASREERYATLILDAPTEVDAVRYYSRGGSSNGRVGKYIIEVSDNNQDWKEVARGEWKNEEGWKLASFEPVSAQYVRLVGEETFGDGNQNNKFMSAVELRVRKAPAHIDFSDPAYTFRMEVSPDPYLTKQVDAEHPAKPTVRVFQRVVTPAPEGEAVGTDRSAAVAMAETAPPTEEETELRQDIDYVVSYESNEAYGQAKAIVEGIVNYTGKLEKAFSIVVPKVTESSITATPKNEYYAGSFFDPTGLEVTLTFEDGSKETITYDETTKEQFAFSPSTETPLEAEMPAVQISVHGQTLSLPIQVHAKPQTQALEAAMERAKEANIADQELLKKMEQALQEAQVLLDRVEQEDFTLTQKEVDAATAKLEALLAEAAKPELQWDALKALIEEVKGLDRSRYLNEGQKELDEALAAARALVESGADAQKAIDDAFTRLFNAKEALIEKPSKEALKALTDEVDQADRTGKSEAVTKALETALQNAKDVLANDQATAQEVDAAQIALRTAWDAFLQEAVNPEKPDPDPEKPNPDPEKPNPDPEKPDPEKPNPEKPNPPEYSNPDLTPDPKPGESSDPGSESSEPAGTTPVEQKPGAKPPVSPSSGAGVATGGSSKEKGAPETGDLGVGALALLSAGSIAGWALLQKRKKNQ